MDVVFNSRKAQAQMKKLFVISIIIAAMASEPALAYTGPGLGAATIAIVVGFFTSIFVALFAVIWYPVKRLLKNRKKSRAHSAATNSSDDIATLKKADPEDAASGEAVK